LDLAGVFFNNVREAGMRFVRITFLLFLLSTGSVFAQVHTAKVGEAVKFTVLFNPSQQACDPQVGLAGSPDDFIVNSIFPQGAEIIFMPNIADTTRAILSGTVGRMNFKGKCEEYGTVYEPIVGVGTADSAVRCRPFSYQRAFHVDSATKQYIPVVDLLRLYNTVADTTVFSDFKFSTTNNITFEVRRSGQQVTEVKMPPLTYVDTLEVTFTSLEPPPDSEFIGCNGYVSFRARNALLDTEMTVIAQLMLEPLHVPTPDPVSVDDEASDENTLRIYYSNHLTFVEVNVTNSALPTLTVSDVLGKTILRPATGQRSTGIVRYPLPLTPGIYFVNALVGDVAYTKKILVP
jgi:hypothetical protein